MDRIFDVFGEEWELKDSPDELYDPETFASVGSLYFMADKKLWLSPGLEGRERDDAIVIGVAGVFRAVFRQRLARANLIRVEPLPLC